jgi:hypothetical protein
MHEQPRRSGGRDGGRGQANFCSGAGCALGWRAVAIAAIVDKKRGASGMRTRSGVIVKTGLRLGLACIVVSTFGKWSASEKLTQAGATPWIYVQRSGLTTVRATGTPSGFSFTYDVAPISGDNVVGVDYAKGVTQSTNPNDANLVNPDPLGPPVPGGLAEVTASYGDGASAARRSVRVSTFGMSCYYTT